MLGLASLVRIIVASLALAAMTSVPSARAADIHLAPTGTLRAVYLNGNPAQAVKNPQTGEITGIAADLAHELAKQAGVPLDLAPARGVQAIIDAVRTGSADIGFLANDPSRAGQVVFSETYLRNPQGVLTLAGSPLNAVADIEKPGFKIGVLRGDSIALWLARNKPGVRQVIRDPDGPSEAELLKAGTIDAFAGNRLRMTTIAASTPSVRVLPGSIMGVPQAIVVKADNTAGLAAVNEFIDRIRSNGFLQASITKAANGTEMEPAPTQE